MRFSNDQVSSAYDEYLDALEYDEDIYTAAQSGDSAAAPPRESEGRDHHQQH